MHPTLRRVDENVLYASSNKIACDADVLHSIEVDVLLMSMETDECQNEMDNALVREQSFGFCIHEVSLSNESIQGTFEPDRQLWRVGKCRSSTERPRQQQRWHRILASDMQII